MFMAAIEDFRPISSKDTRKQVLCHTDNATNKQIILRKKLKSKFKSVAQLSIEQWHRLCSSVIIIKNRRRRCTCTEEFHHQLQCNIKVLGALGNPPSRRNISQKIFFLARNNISYTEPKVEKIYEQGLFSRMVLRSHDKKTSANFIGKRDSNGLGKPALPHKILSRQVSKSLKSISPQRHVIEKISRKSRGLREPRRAQYRTRSRRLYESHLAVIWIQQRKVGSMRLVKRKRIISWDHLLENGLLCILYGEVENCGRGF
ncbi:hypothetical protein Bhyg_05765 [Pseudolycoriella hygida]|uniref:Uncharacterized protein n=1 Tax=Pseudolycoriella hygida TaxID=35572 RepID=A0A9Q0N0Q4_9DIPT|nr:hypothetical protein Bhyg_05765 [Pseudolycoriella hygida]